MVVICAVIQMIVNFSSENLVSGVKLCVGGEEAYGQLLCRSRTVIKNKF